MLHKCTYSKNKKTIRIKLSIDKNIDFYQTKYLYNSYSFDINLNNYIFFWYKSQYLITLMIKYNTVYLLIWYIKVQFDKRKVW